MHDRTSALLRSEFWKGHLLSPETPRIGDKAVVAKDHRCRPGSEETGLLVKVVNNPVFGSIYCEHCGQRVDEWVVEVELIDHIGRKLNDGVYAYPVKWLQRVLSLRHVDSSQKQVAVL
jgi:hypothetical protein